MAPAAACPCGSRRDYAHCCGLLHSGHPAADAETLMRSRYSAYALGLTDYVLGSWHASTRPTDLHLREEPGKRPTWLGLSIKRHRAMGPDSAEVEFVARYRVGGGTAVRLHENSRFLREAGNWFYVDGEHR